MAKLPVGPASDGAEHEADTLAAAAVAPLHGGAAPSAAAVAASLSSAMPATPQIARKVGDGAAPAASAHAEAGPAVDVTAPHISRSIRHATGLDVGGARILVGGPVDARADALHALAFTAGNQVHVHSRAYRPGTPHGDLLLAHELIHVGRGHAGTMLRRFETSERGQITNLDAVMDTASSIADDRGLWGMMRWGRFTAGASGSGALEALGSTRSRASSLPNRYLYTCQCGLVDMRHFYQLMYIGLLRGNDTATEQGREHELNAEATSRFAPEDTPSNALGAYFGSQQSVFQRQSTFVANLRAFLEQCSPVDFTALSPEDQDGVVDYYGARDARGVPMSQNETARPAVLPVAACGAHWFPFRLDPNNPHENTIEGRAAPPPPPVMGDFPPGPTNMA
jgi:hypothetical protein